MQEKLLDGNSTAAVRVYAVWFEMVPGDSRERWPKKLLSDPRVEHFWDARKMVGAWYAKFPEYETGYDVLWDAYLLYGPGSRWEARPSHFVRWGFPIIEYTEELETEFRKLVGSSVSGGSAAGP